jgi:hypothetical protein
MKAVTTGPVLGADAIGDVTCWCIPYGWLTAFYARIGFEVAPIDEAPDFLADRHRVYGQHGLDVAIMVRKSKTHA